MILTYTGTIAVTYFILRKAYKMAQRELNDFADCGLWLMIIIMALPFFINIIVSLIILLVQIPREYVSKFFRIK